ncbi:hypothetical protein ACF0H5_023121 [Mactra antiquata]
MSNTDLKLPVYKKLPAIQPEKMNGRKVMSPSMVTVDFSPNGVAKKSVIGGQNGKSISSTHKLSNQNPASRSLNHNSSSKSPPGGKSTMKQDGDVALSNSPKGIELIGFKYRDDISEVKTTNGINSEEKSQTNGWTPLSTELPPCKICGDKASGLHYGVNTCEACKAFFRRTLKKSKVEFMCTCSKEEKLLGTDVPRKFSCAKCRYERCINVGMSKDAIKIGRYTITRKRQNDREVKSIKAGQPINDGRKLSESSSKSSSSMSPYSTSQSVSSPEELSSDITTLSLQTTMKTQNARKRRHDDDNDPEDGFLFRSLTNSIILSLRENQKKTPIVTSPEAFPADLVMNYMQPPPPEETPSAFERLLMEDSNTVKEQPPFEDLNSLEFTAPEFQEINNQKIANQLLVDSLSADNVSESSPIEKLLLNNDSHVENIPIKSFDLVEDDPDILAAVNDYQPIQGQVQGHHTTDLVTKEMKDEPYLANSIHQSIESTDTGNESHIKILLKVEQTNSDINSLTPMESLFMTPASLSTGPDNVDLVNLNPSINATMPLKEELVNRTDDCFTCQNEIENTCTIPDDKNVVLYGVNIGDPINTKAENCEENVFIATKIDPNLNDPFDVAYDYIKRDLSENIFTADNVDDLEIQKQQLNRFENPALVVGESLALEEARQIVVSLLIAASVLFDTPKFTCAEIKQRHKEYLEQYTLKKQVFGNMSNVSKEEYLEVYNQTGLEIDNRQQILIESLQYIEDSIQKLVMFSKSIPGFSELHIDDQVNLVKVSRLDFQMLKVPASGACLKRSNQDIETTPWLKEYHVEEITKIYPADLITNKKQVCMEIHLMTLSREEILVLQAIVVTFPDRCYLREPDKVERIHDRLISCFLHLLSKRPVEKILSIRTIMKTLFKLRVLSAWDNQIVQELFEVWPASSNHQLAKEVVSL